MTHETPPLALVLDQTALDQARKHLSDGVVTPSYGPWRASVVALLNGALATELVCVLRYKRHHFTAHGRTSRPRPCWSAATRTTTPRPG